MGTRGQTIARNTLFLYIRSFISMAISLYTSRVFLQILGVDNFGIYNIVGGTVGMLSVVTGSLNGAISRFITVSLGKGDNNNIRIVFSTCVYVMVTAAIVILVVGEIVGLWMLNNKLNIPTDRMYAAHWVLQCSLLTFSLGLLNVPYSSCIVAHEKMDIFAYIGLLEIILRLVVLYMLCVFPGDKLIAYSVMLAGVSVLIRFIYGRYCVIHFFECRNTYRTGFDKNILKAISGFSGWSLLGTCAYVLSSQGVSILINVFFGVALNAARAVALQVESAITRFVNDFMTALNPQITKSHAKGDNAYMHDIMCRGTKYSCFLMLLFIIPIELEAHTILSIWLAEVPQYTVIFLRLTLIDSLILLLGQTSLTAIFSTGNIRNYEIVASIIAFLVFPIVWILFKLNFSPGVAYIVHILLFFVLDVARLFFLRHMTGFKITHYVKTVLYPIFIVVCLSIPLPILIHTLCIQEIVRLLLVVVVSTFMMLISVYTVGCNPGERCILKNIICNILRRISFKHI